jgi:hypothetical protein
MISADDVNALYVYALEGNIEHVQFLTTNIKFHFIHLVKAYRYALERGLKLQGNDTMRESMQYKIHTLRKNKQSQVDKLDIKNDLSLLEQGKLSLECSKYLFTLLEPYLIRQDQVTILFFYLCKINKLFVIRDFVAKYIDYIDFDYQNDKGQTVLHLVCKYNNDELVAFLLPYCDTNVQDYYCKNNTILNNTALHYAVETRNLLIIKLLLVFKVNVNIKNYFDLTPLNDVEPGPNGNPVIFELLFANGADINTKCCDKTILYKLVEENDYRGVNYVLSLGADPFVTSKCHYIGKSSKTYYETPLMLATDTIYEDAEDQLNNMKIISLLANI